MFFPSECSYFRIFLSTECSSPQIGPPFRKPPLQNCPPCFSIQKFLTSERSSFQNSFLQNVFHYPSECSSLESDSPSKFSSLESVPLLRMFLLWKCSSPQMFLPWRQSSPQNVPALKAFLPSECSSLETFLPSECPSIESVPPLRMFLPWKCSSPQNVPPLKAFLPSECSSFESVPPLRMFLPGKKAFLPLECSSNKNIPLPLHVPLLEVHLIWNTSCVWLCALPCIYLGTDTCSRYEGKVRIVHSAQCGGITEAEFLVSWPGGYSWLCRGKGLSYRPARQYRLAGLYDNSMPESAIFPSQGLRIWHLEIHALKNWFIMEKMIERGPC
jgi:hypothetical protein